MAEPGTILNAGNLAHLGLIGRPMVGGRFIEAGETLSITFRVWWPGALYVGLSQPGGEKFDPHLIERMVPFGDEWYVLLAFEPERAEGIDPAPHLLLKVENVNTLSVPTVEKMAEVGRSYISMLPVNGMADASQFPEQVFSVLGPFPKGEESRAGGLI